ncbi:SDR family NAD(P)-dependent oxidoreductase [Clostridium estertheticum]|uniref:SDR family NAD(P)-dependent oxidoreductase n=1 Tax=Clostridium estertheticum TaxID=238834 RepID=UPI001CF4C6FE|nr:SDR family NAD(P)-dependent oxidoreductase [Clostridium estertheticum]MCB2360147.1 SDR family NAD(P)-dependent oxidoreductase [Clostridium estertheticum]
MDGYKKQTRTFLQKISNSNYIVRDHQVHGVRTVPGVTLLDMIYRLAEGVIGTRQFELKNILFKQPVVTTENFDKNVSVTFIPREDNWQVVIKSQKVKDDTILEANYDENMECLLIEKELEFKGKRLDLDLFIHNSQKQFNMDELYGLVRQVEIEHFVFMKTLGTVYQKDDEEIMKLHLSELAEKYRGRFYAHPAFLDGSTLAGSSFRLVGKEEDSYRTTPYIPFTIERFCIYKPLPKTVYTYSQKRHIPMGDSIPDIVSTNIKILSETGEVLVEFDNLSAKRVREPNLIKKLVKSYDIISQNKEVIEKSINDSEINYSDNTLDCIIYYLRDEISKELKKNTNEIDIYTGFYDLGLDSTQLLILVKNLEKKVQQDLYPTLLFEYSSVQRLAEYILENYAGNFTDRNGKQTKVVQENNVVTKKEIVQNSNSSKLLIFNPRWIKKDISNLGKVSLECRNIIILYNGTSLMASFIMENIPKSEVIILSSNKESIPYRIEDKFIQLVGIIQNHLNEKPQIQLRLQVVADSNEEGMYANIFSALIKSAYLETQKIYGQIITIKGMNSKMDDELVEILKKEAHCHSNGISEIRYIGEPLTRYVRKLYKKEMSQEKTQPYYKENGVYVITGGLGGVGYLIANQIATNIKAKLVLIGSTKLNEIKGKQINKLLQKGSEVLYIQADISNKEDAIRAYSEVKSKFGYISGIIHGAGIIKDQLIFKKDLEEIQQVLRPKVRGLWNLDLITRDEKMDFFVTMSSTSAITGNLGQGDYSSANAFMDVFTCWRDKQVMEGARYGKTITVNWPLWDEGGMQVDEGLKRLMYDNYGIDTMPSEQGLQALTTILNENNVQNIVFYGEENKICDHIREYIEDGKNIESSISNADFITCDKQEKQFIYNQYKKNKYMNSSDDIVIIGLSGRYPMANTMEQFYNNLKTGKDCISTFPKERWKNYQFSYDIDEFYKYGGFIDGIDQFDPLFFNISPRQAEIMDPQARIFLEVAWEACEDAGFYIDKKNHYYPSLSDNSVGVFTGVFWNHYELFAAEMSQKHEPTAFGVCSASIPNMVSYCLNLHGPSMSVDTMCSSSLTALHLASDSIRKGECDYAIAGGVNLVTHPHKYMFLKNASFLSADGRCRSFGEGGDGYVPGEGVGAVLLTTLEKAEKEGYHIYGIIKGSSLNHVGKTSGATVPDPVAQSEVIKDALKKANIDSRTVSYIEAHGTGTSLGDPIEIQGLRRAFNDSTNDKQYCAIGSLKSNIGHLEGAAGIAGLTKLLLQLKYKQIFPSLHSEKLNPYIPFSDTQFYVEQDLREWQRPVINIDGDEKVYPRIAGLSAFGANGSNAHTIIQEYIKECEEIELTDIGRIVPVIIPISAKNPNSLKTYAQKLLDYIRVNNKVLKIEDVAYTFQTGRENMTFRLALIVYDLNDLEQKLQLFIDGKARRENYFMDSVKKDKELVEVMNSDEDIQESIEKWISKGKISKLGGLWTKGLDIDWKKMYFESKPKRISLPTYPFDNERYWAPDYDRTSNLENIESKSNKENKELKKCFVKKHWKLSPEFSSRKVNGIVAILSNKDTKQLAENLSNKFIYSEIIDIDCIITDDKFDSNTWKQYDGFIDLIGCSIEESSSLDWITWIQRLLDFGKKNGIMLLCVTKVLESYKNNEINLCGASRVGLYRMLKCEYSFVTSRHMDTECIISERELVEQIYNEFLIHTDASEICYRDGKRYEAYLDEFNYEECINNSFQFPGDHVLCITGGTRGLGYLCAKHFVAQYGVKKLVLIGSEILPPREQWDFYKDKNDSLAQKIKNIKALEDMGVFVEVLSIELSNKEIVQESIRVIKETMGSFGGVIHCAGRANFEGPAFIRKSLEGIETVLNPKISGLNVIYEVLKNEPLNFFINFSSVSAIIPSLAVGQSDYAMANAYMDYFAESKHSQCPIVSIQWPNWKDTGMGEVKGQAYKATGLTGLTDIDGLEILDFIILKKSIPVVLPALVNKKLWKPNQLMKDVTKKTPIKNIKVNQSNDGDNENFKSNISNNVDEWVVGLFAKELRINHSKLELDVPFQDYGLDSILFSQILRNINNELECDIDPSILYEYSTIESFSKWLQNNFSSSLVKKFKISDVSQEDLQVVNNENVKGEIYNKENSLDIAVVGITCRFPGASNVDEYWSLLSEGRSAIKAFPAKKCGYENTFYAGILEDTIQFDNDFFLIPKEDTKVMDPQGLLLLEESLKLCNNAGYSLDKLKGKRIGVYIGGRSQNRPDEALLNTAINPIIAVGQNYLAANISQFFDLRGPSIVLDTACSSSLVAMNMAIQALKNGEIEAAMIGGASLLNGDETLKLFKKRGILSKNFNFHVFDQRSDGIILGEGVGMVLLKTKERAIKDDDKILAVVKSIAINNDGRTAGPATPNIQAQKEVMSMALEKSGKNSEEITYIETNGYGSEVTDLLELKAIQSVYRNANNIPCALGSMKPNIGHPLCAEGIASFIKVVLMLNNKKIVPFLSGQEPMIHYDIQASPFYFCRNLTEWTSIPRTASINCFADGGTNAHVILESFVDEDTSLPYNELGVENEDVLMKMFWETFD